MNARTRRLVFLAVVTAFALLGTGADCGRHRADFPADPMPPVGPDSTWAGAPTSYRVSTTIGRGMIRYVMDWDGAMDTTDASYASGETATVAHVWNSPGTVSVKVQAINDAYPEKASEWSTAKTVRVIAYQWPEIDSIRAPSYTPVGVPAEFTFFVSGGDSVRLKVKWGDGTDTLTPLRASPCSIAVSHVFSKAETLLVLAWAIDERGTQSQPDSLLILIGHADAVIWHWWNDDENRKAGTTSVLAFFDGSDEVVGMGCGDGRYYAIKIGSGRATSSVTTKFLGYGFTGHSGFCAATNHVIVGSDEGLLYGLKLNLGREWVWPDVSNETLLTFNEWGAPAIIGRRIYVGRKDDSLYCFEDADSQAIRIATYGPGAGIVDAPAIDVQGNVYFGTDSGYLYKMDANLTAPVWRTPLQGNGRIYGPIIGGEGTIYCTSDSFHLFAIDPANGAPRWKIVLDGEALRPVLGPSALFVGTSYGKVYSISQTTGAITWQKQLAPDAFETTPIVTTGGYVYIQNTDDVLYCINQADGTVIWSCDCKRWLPRTGHPNRGRSRQFQLVDYLPNPSILSNGNIIVVGADALYCVQGYPERPLDPTAPWPKWQHDLYNTGHGGGGSR